MIRNVHEREIPMSPADAWALVDRVAEPDGVLWPGDHWPPMRMDRPLAVGATGGHGPIRYTCTGYEPGTAVEFTFARSAGVVGTHTFSVLPGSTPDTCVMRHVLTGGARTLGTALRWGLVIRWLHDAVLEELLDRAEAGGPVRTTWSPWVRAIRAVTGMGGDRRGSHHPATG